MPKKGHKPRSKKHPVYAISIAAQLANLPIHTVRWLESNRLIEPARTNGKQRLYSDLDIELLREMADLLDKKINVAGIREIISLRRTYFIQEIPINRDTGQNDDNL